MLIYVLKRIVSVIPVMLAVTFLLFTLLYFTPGDPALLALGEDAPPESLAQFRAEHNLDKPYLIRYAFFLYNAVVHQDIGRSYVTRRPVANELNNVLPVTIQLVLRS